MEDHVIGGTGYSRAEASSSGAATYQPTNLSTYQPINLLTYQPINLSTHQPINPSTYQPINLSTHQPINPSTHQPINPSTYYFCAMWLIKQVWYYIDYLLRAKRPAQMHSPYLFALLGLIHDRSREYYDFHSIESIRAELLRSTQTIPREDYGAGSRTKNQTVQQIARTALSSREKCQMVFRLIVQEKPKTILELGTSLGIMSAYLGRANTSARVHTLEGNASLTAIAQDIAKTLHLSNIHFHSGRFSDVLPQVLANQHALDFVLIDGDHRGASLKAYYHMVKPHLSENAIVMIDDIRWSKDMYAAWKELLNDPEVRCSLDYFDYGILFFRRDFLDKLHFLMRSQ